MHVSFLQGLFQLGHNCPQSGHLLGNNFVLAKYFDPLLLLLLLNNLSNRNGGYGIGNSLKEPLSGHQ